MKLKIALVALALVAAGDTNGQGANDVWYVLGARGDTVKEEAPSPNGPLTRATLPRGEGEEAVEQMANRPRAATPTLLAVGSLSASEDTAIESF